jgi:hypothetical protein
MIQRLIHTIFDFGGMRSSWWRGGATAGRSFAFIAALVPDASRGQERGP